MESEDQERLSTKATKAKSERKRNGALNEYIKKNTQTHTHTLARSLAHTCVHNVRLSEIGI